MSFSYSNGLITQSGTDTDLSGMVGLTGVTKNGNQYTLDNTRLLVTGTLDVDRTTDRLRFVNYADLAGRVYIFRITGTFDNSIVRTYQNTIINDPLPSISFEYEKSNGGNNGPFDGYIETTSTSNVTIQGMVNLNDDATTGSQFNLAHRFEGNVSLDNAIFINSTIGTLKLIFTTETASNITINNCEFYGHGYRTAANGLTVNGLKTFGHTETINVNTGNFVSDLTLEGIEGYGVATIFRNAAVTANQKFVRYINPFSSIAAPIPLSGLSLSSAAGSQTIVQNRMIFTAQDANGVVPNAKIQAIDVNNGNRPTTNYGPSQTYEIATSGDITYSATTDVNGNATLLVTSAVWYLGTSSTDRNVDNRGVSNSYDLNYKLASFSHLPSNLTPNHYASGNKTPAFLLSLDASQTETNEATILSYSENFSVAGNLITIGGTGNTNSNRVYDLGKKYWYDNFNREDLYVTRSGNLINAGNYNVSIGSNIIFTGDMTTTGVITLANGAVFNGTRTDQNGTVIPLQPINITNIVAGSRLQIFNVTTNTETVNTTVSGTSYTSSYTEGVEYTDGDTVRIRLTKLGKSEWSGNVIDTNNGFNVLAEQVEDEVYTALGVDGSTVTKFQADYTNNEIDLIIATNWTQAELYAWWTYNLTSEDGIRIFYGGITAVDQANFRINTTIVNLFLDNTTNASYIQTDNRRFFRDTGDGYPVKTPTTSGYGLDVVWRTTIIPVDNPALITATTAIQAKTDQLNFTGTDVKATLDGEEVVADTASRDASKADVSGLSTFDSSTDEVTTDTASREASKADVTNLRSNQNIINEGVEKASLFIPHKTNVD